MAFIETQWWLLELPDEWSATQEEDAIVITDEDGVGELVITTLQKQNGTVSEQEVLEYAQDAILACGGANPVSVSDADGLYAAFNEGDEHIREWYLRFEDLFLLITYCCDSDNAGMDDAAIDEILSTLCFRVADTEH